MITQEYLKSRLSYDPDTGVFTWKVKPGFGRTTKSWNTRYSGTVAGTVHKVDKSDDLCYIFINLLDIPRRAHRLAWLYVYGEDAPLLDHIDGNGLNNRISNLRPLSGSDNIRKGKISKKNTSGFKGVSYRKDTNRWTARCKVGKMYKSLGSFDTKEEAFKVYSQKVLELTGELHENLIIK